MNEPNQIGTASYDPGDNKLRMYPAARLPKDLYERVRGAGFSWAPKQELFVAPMWTPEREDLLLELCGEIEDEDKSLVERAEERADRFEDYSAARADDAGAARAAVASICDGIPFGQPILVGHHSERHARRDAEKIENGMRRTVKMWEQSNYWKQRAAGAVRAAKYKEKPAVRARRIKKIEADKRGRERTILEAQRGLRFWNGEMKLVNQVGEKRPLTICEENRKHILNHLGNDSSAGYFEFPLATYPRQAPASQYEGMMSLWSALGGGSEEGNAVCTLDQARELSVSSGTRSIDRCNRWLTHYSNRLEYERAMLAADGGTVADKTGPEVGGACRCWASPGYGKGWAYITKVNRVSVTIREQANYGGKIYTLTVAFDKLHAVMTAAAVQAARDTMQLIEIAGATGFHLRNAPLEPEQPAAIKPEDPQRAEVEAIRETLKADVQVVTAPQLFPTPADLARRMVEAADVQPGQTVLEPSAGTGAILSAIDRAAASVTAIEINKLLADALRSRFGIIGRELVDVRNDDFLTCNGNLGKFDRIIMNPPFSNGADVAHIRHAMTFLRPGGRLVALCANGSRQRAELQPLADEWIDLPDGSFSEQGTGVNVAMLVING